MSTRGNALPPIDAATLRAPQPLYFYSAEHSQQVHEEILRDDPDLQRRVVEEQATNAGWDARGELSSIGQCRMEAAYDALSSAEKRPYEQKSLDAKHSNWRTFRAQNRLIESEESLAQKADDEKGITGSVDGRGRGGGSASSSSTIQQQQVTGTFIGGELLTPVQELTPPFDRNTLRMKIWKIEPEEYY